MKGYWECTLTEQGERLLEEALGRPLVRRQVTVDRAEDTALESVLHHAAFALTMWQEDPDSGPPEVGLAGRLESPEHIDCRWVPVTPGEGDDSP